MTREEIKRQIKDKEFGPAPYAEPNCFETDQEVIWWKIGAREGFDKGVDFADENPVNPWHSVEEELPKCESKYFVRIEDSKGLEYFDCVSWFITPTSRWWSLGRYTMFGRVKVTHWMPIPELPKENED